MARKEERRLPERSGAIAGEIYRHAAGGTLVSTLALAALACGAGAPAVASTTLNGEAWWRTDGTGRYPGTNPPLTWSATQNVVWKRPLKNWSNATPVLHRGRIFTCEEPATLVCLDQRTGEELWRAEATYDEFAATSAARERAQRESSPPGSASSRSRSTISPAPPGSGRGTPPCRPRSPPRAAS